MEIDDKKRHQGYFAGFIALRSMFPVYDFHITNDNELVMRTFLHYTVNIGSFKGPQFSF